MKKKFLGKLLLVAALLIGGFSDWPQDLNFLPHVQTVAAAEYLSNPSFTGGYTD
jgi:hypothetical protein